MNVKGLFAEALPIISKFAPTIARAIGGPYSMAAGFALPIIANAFQKDPKDIPGIVQSILTDPQAPEALGQLEHDHSDWLCGLMENINNLVSAEINIKLQWNSHAS